MKLTAAIFMIGCTITSASSPMDYLKKEIAKKMLQNALEEAKKDPFIDVRIPYGKENKKEKTHDELWQDNRTYFKSLGAAMFKSKNTGILYVDKLREQLKKFKNN